LVTGTASIVLWTTCAKKQANGGGRAVLNLGRWAGGEGSDRLHNKVCPRTGGDGADPLRTETRCEST